MHAGQLSYQLRPWSSRLICTLHTPTHNRPQEPNKGVNPDEAVAYGAAVQVGIARRPPVFAWPFAAWYLTPLYAVLCSPTERCRLLCRWLCCCRAASCLACSASA